jgi:hypothetical protein
VAHGRQPSLRVHHAAREAVVDPVARQPKGARTQAHIYTDIRILPTCYVSCVANAMKEMLGSSTFRLEGI